MSIQIRPDAKTLAVLFPEGSEARIELQGAIMAKLNSLVTPKTDCGPLPLS